MNTLRTIRSVIRANPQYAIIAAIIDVTIGFVAGLVAYVAINAIGVGVGMTVALAVNFFLFTTGIVALVAAVAISRGLVEEFGGEE